jgi:parallel beta-helix repeat protein
MHQPTFESTARAALTLLVAGLVVTAGLPGVAAGVAASADSATPIQDCRTIDEAGEYVLAGNLTVSDDCLSVTADGVTIDGAGYGIVGNGSGTAISAAGVDELTVSNVTVTNWATGVSLRDVTDARVADTVVDTASLAVAIDDGARDVTLADSEIRNGSLGVRIHDDVSDVAIADTEFTALTGMGVDLRGAEGRVVNSTFDATGGAAVRVTGDEVLFANNSVQDTVGGIVVADAAAVTVRANTFDDVQGSSIHVGGIGDVEVPRNRPAPNFRGGGVVLHPMLPSGMAELSYGGLSDAVDDTGTTTRRYVDVTLLSPTPPEPVRIVDNVVRDSRGNGIVAVNTTAVIVAENRVIRSRDGVRIVGGSDAELTNNTAVSNRDDGITIAASADATLVNNTVVKNTDDGVYVTGDGAVVMGTLARNNSDDGVDVHNVTLASIRDNRLLKNGDDGLYLRFVLNGTVELNSVHGNADDGVDLRAVTGTGVSNNSICWNDHHEFVARNGTSNTTVANNTC